MSKCDAWLMRRWVIDLHRKSFSLVQINTGARKKVSELRDHHFHLMPVYQHRVQTPLTSVPGSPPFTMGSVHEMEFRGRHARIL